MKITKKNLEKLILEETNVVLGEENRASALEREIEVMRSLVYIIRAIKAMDTKQEEILRHVKKYTEIIYPDGEEK